MADADIMAALIALLASDAAIGDAVGSNIYGSELPAEAVARMPMKALVVRPSGGPSILGASDAQLDHQRVDILAYGPTPKAANDLLRRVSPLFRTTKRRVFAGVLIHWINGAGGSIDARDTDGQWPQSFRSFQVLHSTTEILP